MLWLAALLASLAHDAPPHTAVPGFLHNPIRRLAIHAELIDRREFTDKLVYGRSPITFRFLYNRAYDLYDAPPLFHENLWPSRETLQQHITLNRNYAHYLSSLAEQNRLQASDWCEMKTIIDKTYAIYDAARDARCDYYYVHIRRTALKRLRTQLGEQNYYSGRLPLPVPLDWFKPID